MTQFEKSDGPFGSFESDEMMRTARSLQRFVRKIQKNGFFDAKSDILLFDGTLVAIPVLLAFATELALKALLYRGGHKKLERTHNLIHLYEKLNKELRNRIEEKKPIFDPYELVKFSGSDTLSCHTPVGKVLNYHKDAFKEWRYLHENHNNERYYNMSFHQGALDRVLDAIISVYDENYGRHR